MRSMFSASRGTQHAYLHAVNRDRHDRPPLITSHARNSRKRWILSRLRPTLGQGFRALGFRMTLQGCKLKLHNQKSAHWNPLSKSLLLLIRLLFSGAGGRGFKGAHCWVRRRWETAAKVAMVSSTRSAAPATSPNAHVFTVAAFTLLAALPAHPDTTVC